MPSPFCMRRGAVLPWAQQEVPSRPQQGAPGEWPHLQTELPHDFAGPWQKSEANIIGSGTSSYGNGSDKRKRPLV